MDGSEKLAGLPPRHGMVRPGDLRGSTLTVARALLGQNLCRRIGDDIVRWRLSELEVYEGLEDRASHAHRGMTPRNQIMFGPPGHWYIYLCYGVHWLLNLVTGPADYPAAILIRGAGEVRGPGRLTRALQIDGSCNTQPIRRNSGLWLEWAYPILPEDEILRTPRIGIGYAGSPWTEMPWRLVWDRD